ncbi:MAG: hypothetical protein M5U28_15240 [Sandaracinaceae bacterium]|nr:hypothetical protein [Sandaracinaceae bacterium]
MSAVGGRHRKVGAMDRIRGVAAFTDDLALPGMLHAKILRSPHAHARILAIDASAALATEGVAAVITGRDLPRPLRHPAVDARRERPRAREGALRRRRRGRARRDRRGHGHRGALADPRRLRAAPRALRSRGGARVRDHHQPLRSHGQPPQARGARLRRRRR